ncbi:MAG TPA: peptide chain release factor N(5)-glutamine methyltransferase [bacterium]|nr:peptide chain release factor N(5)-glutamine methyltransferase [bacterium]
MTIGQVLMWAREILKQADSVSPVLDAEILLSEVLNKPHPNPFVQSATGGFSLKERGSIDRAFLYAHPEKKITNNQELKYKKMIRQRVKGEPVAYILGYKEFYGLKFLVNKEVLVPRPETELMVDNVVSECQSVKVSECQDCLIIDVGVGSGCIPITLIKRFKIYNLRFKILAIDISDKTLAVAKNNAKLHNVDKKIKFIKSDLLENISKSLFLNHKSIILTANLPYLSESIYKKNYQNLKFEPSRALLAGKDGLKYYRRLLKQIKELISKKQDTISKFKSVVIFLEIGPEQKLGISKLIKKYLPLAKIEFKKDLSGQNRLIMIKYKQHL